MKKTFSTIIALAAASTLMLTGCSGETGTTGSDGGATRDFTMGTGGTGGTFYPLGSELAGIFQDNVDGLTVNPVETGGGTDNLGRLFQGQHQVGMSSNDITNMAVSGELDGLDGQSMDNIGWLSALFPEAAHIIVRADSGIERVEDLKGRRVAVGNAGSGTRTISDAILGAHGLGEEDYTPEVTDFSSSADMLTDGQIDASIFVVGVPTSGLAQLAATTDVALLTIDDAIVGELSNGSDLESYSISASSYDFLDDDVPTISVFANLLASLDAVSEDDGYGITKALYDHVDEITLDVGRSIVLDNALKGIGSVPLHPGAAKFYEEQGIEIP